MTNHTSRIITPLPTKHELILELVEGLERDLHEALDALQEIARTTHVYPTTVDELLRKYGRTP